MMIHKLALSVLFGIIAIYFSRHCQWSEEDATRVMLTCGFGAASTLFGIAYFWGGLIDKVWW